MSQDEIPAPLPGVVSAIGSTDWAQGLNVFHGQESPPITLPQD